AARAGSARRRRGRVRRSREHVREVRVHESSCGCVGIEGGSRCTTGGRLRGCAAVPARCRNPAGLQVLTRGGESMNKARLIFVAVMLLLIVQALLVGLGSPPLG